MMDDDILIAAFLESRSDAAFTALYRRHAAAVYGLAVRLCGQAAADDIAQDAWIRAMRRLEAFDGRSAFRTWLCGIVVNCCRERWRSSTSEGEPIDTGTASDFTRVLDVREALAQLAPGYRAVVVLHDLYGYTHDEIARLLDLDEGTSKSQLSRGRRALRTLLKDTTHAR
jgi:RNA polymerase sigma-70 factor (ECF subfamily)